MGIGVVTGGYVYGETVRCGVTDLGTIDREHGGVLVLDEWG